MAAQLSQQRSGLRSAACTACAASIACFLSFTSVSAQTTSAPSTPSATLAALGEKYVEETYALNPLAATSAGDARFHDKFVNDLTPAVRERDRKLQSETLAALKAIDVAALSADDQLTHAVMMYRAQLRLDALALDFHLTPINHFFSLPLSLVSLARAEGAQPFKTVADYDAFLKRLDGFPGWVDSAISNMREGIQKNVVQPKVVMNRVLPQLKTLMASDATQSGFYVPIQKLPTSFSEAERVRLTNAYRAIINDKLVPAITKLHTFIAQEYLPKCRETVGLAGIPNGDAKYAFRARESTTTQLPPAEIHQIGLREVARIRTEMDAVRKRVGFNGDVQALIESIPKNAALMPFKTEEEVIEAFRKIQRRVDPLVDKLFVRRPRAVLEIRPEPEITKATAAASYRAGARDGSRPGVFFAPIPVPTKYLNTRMTALYMHEGIPGHHFEVSLAQESDLPRIRRNSRFTAYGEGWALYAESLGIELGVYDDPYQDMGRLISEMHRAIRLVVDTGMHLKGWTREQAIQYSLQNGGRAESEQVQEVERYIAIPGQALAYKIGELKIMELRRYGEQTLGPNFSLAAFHNELLKDGNLPLAVLDAKMRRWIAAQAAGK